MLKTACYFGFGLGKSSKFASQTYMWHFDVPVLHNASSYLYCNAWKSTLSKIASS
jgi:hypothetical protein